MCTIKSLNGDTIGSPVRVTEGTTTSKQAKSTLRIGAFHWTQNTLRRLGTTFMASLKARNQGAPISSLAASLKVYTWGSYFWNLFFIESQMNQV